MDMNHDRKVAFLQNMTHMALEHMAKTVNVPDQKGGMSHDKKLAFVQSMAKHGLQHFDTGGTPTNPGQAISAIGSNNQNNFVGQTANAINAASPSSPGQGYYQGNAATNNSATNPNTGLLGSINGTLGLNNQFVAGTANINSGTSNDQLSNAYSGVQGGLAQQQALANQMSSGTTQGLNAQSQLSNQLTNEANGQGPNPAQAALNQSTGQNIAQQAALMAGQRGAGANAGLMASQAAQQGAATQQQAVGQSATLQAQQQLAAQQAQANLAATQVGQGATAVQNVNQQQQNEQNILQGANTSYNNAAVGMQSNMNNVNAQTSAANQNMAANTLGGIMSGASSVASMFARGGVVKKMADGGDVSNGDDTPAFAPTPSDTSSGPSVPGTSSLPADQTNFSQSMGGGGGGGGGAAGLMAMLNKGGSVQQPRMMAQGGYMTPMPLVVNQQNAPQSFVGKWVNTAGNSSNGPTVASTAALPVDATNLGASGKSAGKAGQGSGQAPGQMVAGTPGDDPSDALTSDPNMTGQDSYGNNSGVTMMAYRGGMAAAGGDVRAGKGQRAVVQGDSIKNDKVPTMLSQGELVIDRQTLADPGPMGQMARALKAHIEARNKKSGK